MFETNPKDLKDLLREAHEGRLQLPDFQRSYVWAEDDVRSLIASIAQGFPVGALLTLESGGEVSFKPRLLEGVPLAQVRPDQLLLDGQQRITSLYGTMWSTEPILTRLSKNHQKAVKRLFYLDINKAIEAGADIEEAILSVRDDKTVREDFKVTLDVSTREKEFDAHTFPLNEIFNPWDWIFAWQEHWKQKGEDIAGLRDTFKKQIVDPVQSYKMPVIKLAKSSSREAICLIFEKVNVGGKKLDAFELVTAIFAGQKEPFDLRRDWYGEPGQGVAGRKRQIVQPKVGSGHANAVLSEVKHTDFLQGISLLHTRDRRILAVKAGEKSLPQITCKRSALLELPLPAYQKSADSLEEGFRTAGLFLNEQMILWQKDVPYPAQIVGLATVFSAMGKSASTISAKQQLGLWFWRVALSEDFGSSSESKLAKDMPELIEWIKGGPEPERLARLDFNETRLDSLRSRLSAAYKAISALLLRSGCRDFVSGDPANINTFHGNAMDIHHIFPKAWCVSEKIDVGMFDSIINKTPLTAESNRSIGGWSPAEYLNRIEAKQNLSSDQLDAILRSHLIEPAFLRSNDFHGFHANRKSQLAVLIAQATGRSTVSGMQADEPTFDLPDEPLDQNEEAAA